VIIQYANASAQTLLHLPQNSIGVEFPSHVMQYYFPHPVETWNEWLNDPSPCYLVQPETPKARAFWLLVDAMDATFECKSSRVVRITDVTENLSMHQDMRNFHSAITHKMRTPVSLLVASMSLVEAKLNLLSENEIRDFVKVAVRGVNRLADEVRDVLAYIDAPLLLQRGNKLKLSALPSLVQASQAQAGITDLSLNISKEIPDGEMAITDYAFGLILDELLENSRKFHPQQTPQVEIVVEPANFNNLICVNIRDNGATLTAEQLIWAQRPYHQGEKFFTGEVPGMGLGIPLISTLIWQVGGQIRISNREDRSGIAVVLSLPIQEKD
jgi:K+-sensing histidine kinase KdpD